MKVYFERNFRGSGRGKTPGEKVSVGKTFSWAKTEWTVPAIYLFREGIVVDFCVRVPVEQVEAYLTKWYIEKRLSELSEEELEGMQRDNPFEMDFHVQAYLDGRKLDSMGMCMEGWHPLHPEREAAPEMGEMLMSEYGCSRDSGWSFIRASFRYQNGFHRRKDAQWVPKSVSFRFEKNPVFYPGPHFTAGMGDEGKCVEFVHTGTGETHTLTVQGCEQEEISDQIVSQMKLFHKHVIQEPACYLRMRYTLEPDLSREVFMIRDCANSDAPVMETDSNGAAAIAVIGGDTGIMENTSGPTSDFCAGKLKDRDENRRRNEKAAFSALHYKPVEEVEWRFSFREIETEKKEVTIDLADSESDIQNAGRTANADQ